MYTTNTLKIFLAAIRSSEIGCAAILAAALALIGCSQQDGQSPGAAKTSIQAPVVTAESEPENAPRTAISTASEAQLADDAEVIGVALSTGSRAYLVAGASLQGSHIINDVVDGRPLSVTYCPRTQCARVFTKREVTGSLDLLLGGFRQGEMQLRLDGAMYPHSSDEIPLEEVEFTRTDWKTWRRLHPKTLVFLDAAPHGVAASKS